MSLAVNEMTDAGHDAVDVMDVVGVGFGPSNLGLAIAIEEFNAENPDSRGISARFVESKDEFGWHTGMLIPGTTMQISFLKDLATQRNVRSRFTFLSYLAARGRLVEFINHQTFFPTRLEFHDYLEWAAEAVEAPVDYGTRAVGVYEEGDHLVVETEHRGRRSQLRTRSVVLAGGLHAQLPAGVVESVRQFHNHRLLDQLAELPALTHQRFVVVGAGQSAAEVADHLHTTYPDAEVHGVFAKYGYSPADDSPYANRVFDPTAVDDFYVADPAIRRQLLDYHRGTNYSCVDLPLIEELYTREYAERVAGHRRLFFRGASSVREAVEFGDTTTGGVRVSVEHHPTRTVEELTCDAVVYATGFTPMPLDILGDLSDEILREAPGSDQPSVSRDYRLRTRRPLSGPVFLQGGTEHTHGLTSSLLSNIAIRSGEIVESIVREVGVRA